MRGRKKRISQEAGVDLTAMLDVVFILLIFFVVTSTFIQERALGLEPPPPPTEIYRPLQTSILVQISADNLISVQGRITDITGVRANIERLKAEMPDAGLIIAVSEKARSGTVLKVRDAAYSAQIAAVNVIKSGD